MNLNYVLFTRIIAQVHFLLFELTLLTLFILLQNHLE